MRKDTLVLRLLMCAVIAGAALGCREHRTPPPGGGGTGGPDTMRTGGSGGGGFRDGSTTGGTGGGAAGGSGGSGGTPATDAPASDGTTDVEEPDMVVPDVPITCDPACGMGEVCVNGQCVSPCLPTQTNCPSGCSELPTDPANCGMCGRACPAGQFCSSGTCVMACMNGETRCDQSCVNLDNNVKNCGICGKSCAGAEACVSRVCQCVTPNVVCGGACTNVRNNRDHCGRCNNRCGGDLVCNGTSCGCPGGRRVCPNNPNKCVTSLNECCPSGQSWCANAGNGGGCVDLRSDRNHCNSCTTVCPGQDVCTDRRCICPSTLKDCGGGVCIQPGTCCPGKEQACGDKCIPSADCCSDMECTVQNQKCNLTNNKCECAMDERVCMRAGVPAKCIKTTGACCNDGDCGGGGRVCSPVNNTCGCPENRPQVCGNTCIPADECCAPLVKCPQTGKCVARTELGTCCGMCPVTDQVCSAEGRCTCPVGQVVCGTKCIPREGCCGSCSGNRDCVNNMCFCPQDRTCGNLCCPAGQMCLMGPAGGMRCGVRPGPDPLPGGQPP
jgi:hypothetical protein